MKTYAKVVILGDGGVGKTSLRNQFLHKRFTNNYKATIGADFITKTVEYEDEGEQGGMKSVCMQIWDTAGQERFQALGRAFWRGADACILVYDVTNPASLENLTTWTKEFIRQADIADPDTFPFIMIGNKTDLEGSRIISQRQGQEAARKLKQICIEISGRRQRELEQYRLRAAESAMSVLTSSKKFFDGVDAGGEPSGEGQTAHLGEDDQSEQLTVRMAAKTLTGAGAVSTPNTDKRDGTELADWNGGRSDIRNQATFESQEGPSELELESKPRQPPPAPPSPSSKPVDDMPATKLRTVRMFGLQQGGGESESRPDQLQVSRPNQRPTRQDSGVLWSPLTIPSTTHLLRHRIARPFPAESDETTNEGGETSQSEADPDFSTPLMEPIASPTIPSSSLIISLISPTISPSASTTVSESTQLDGPENYGGDEVLQADELLAKSLGASTGDDGLVSPPPSESGIPISSVPKGLFKDLSFDSSNSSSRNILNQTPTGASPTGSFLQDGESTVSNAQGGGVGIAASSSLPRNSRAGTPSIASRRSLYSRMRHRASVISHYTTASEFSTLPKQRRRGRGAAGTGGGRGSAAGGDAEDGRRSVGLRSHSDSDSDVGGISSSISDFEERRFRSDEDDEEEEVEELDQIEDLDYRGMDPREFEMEGSRTGGNGIGSGWRPTDEASPRDPPGLSQSQGSMQRMRRAMMHIGSEVPAQLSEAQTHAAAAAAVEALSSRMSGDDHAVASRDLHGMASTETLKAVFTTIATTLVGAGTHETMQDRELQDVQSLTFNKLAASGRLLRSENGGSQLASLANERRERARDEIEIEEDRAEGRAGIVGTRPSSRNHREVNGATEMGVFRSGAGSRLSRQSMVGVVDGGGSDGDDDEDPTTNDSFSGFSNNPRSLRRLVGDRTGSGLGSYQDSVSVVGDDSAAMPHFEASAKLGEHVEDAFICVAKLIQAPRYDFEIVPAGVVVVEEDTSWSNMRGSGKGCAC
ncbi:Ras- protein Rab-7A [Blyttiomyces sp. JEL0837]|nr:Ras- protein Rab-7A [Blyttiomyces sp. JEL0837]